MPGILDKDKLPNEGLKKLAEEAPEVVKTMGFKDGGVAIMIAPQEDMKEEMPEAEPMKSDEQMENDYLDFVVEESLSESEEKYLLEKLEQDEQLSMIFDKVMEVATEFAGSGPVEGPGSGVSDSIPARLSDGEFVMTAKSVDTLGSDNLQEMMNTAEMVSDRKAMQDGGPVEEENMMQDNVKVVEQNINVSRPQTQDTPRMMEDNDLVREELTKLSLYDRPHVRS